MNKYLVRLLLLPCLMSILLLAFIANIVSSQNLYPECITRVVGNYEIVGNKELDLDNDGVLDQIILYKNENLHILFALNPMTEACNIVMDEYFTSIDLAIGQQAVEVQEIEMVELTGDTQPELHIWIDKAGGGRSTSASVHAIYTHNAGKWEEIFLIEQCLAFNSLEFQDTAIENVKNIYYDADQVCVTPFSNARTYDVLRWDGDKFISIENGTVVVWSLYPPIWYSICFVSFFGLLVVLILIAVNVRRRFL